MTCADDIRVGNKSARCGRTKWDYIERLDATDILGRTCSPAVYDRDVTVD